MAALFNLKKLLMNLGKNIASLFLEQSTPTIALFPGSFKPPHKGHFEIAKSIASKVDKLIVIINPEETNGIKANQSEDVWNLFKTKLSDNIEIKISPDSSPLDYLYNTVESDPTTQFVVVFGKEEIERYDNLKRYPNVKIFDMSNIRSSEGNLSSSKLAKAIKDKNTTEILTYLPNNITVDEYLSALKITLNESSLFYSNKTQTIKDFIKFAIQQLNISSFPSQIIISKNNPKAKEISSFGSFDPTNKQIWVYIGNRNMADILRTLAHELVHHKQHEDGKLTSLSGETGSPIENEANSTAGILLRNYGKNNKHIYENLQVHEAKQVGTLYHFTSIESLFNILNNNKLKSWRFEPRGVRYTLQRKQYVPNKAVTFPKEMYSVVSFTRDKTFWLEPKFGVETDCYLVIDGDKLSNKYKLLPFNEKFRYSPESDIFELIGDEKETIATGPIIAKNYGIPDIKNYIKEIVLIQFNIDAELEDSSTYQAVSDDIGKNYESIQDIKNYIETTYNIPVKIIGKK